MDPFEVRVQFTALASRLTSSVASISKVAHYALKHAAKCADDIWDCYLDEVASATLNARINLLFLLDSLLDKEGPRLASAPPATQSGTHTSYRDLVERDLDKVVELVVPDSREGVLNWMSTAQVLKSWKTRRLLDHDILERVTADLESRKASLHSSSSDSSPFANFSRNDILRRIEDDRERHKRLKERVWVLPVPSTLFPTSLASTSGSLASLPGLTSQKPSPASPASPFDPSLRRAPTAAAAAGNGPPLPQVQRGPELALEFEFEQLWEAGEDERMAAQREDDTEADPSPSGTKRWRPWPLEPQDREDMRSERRRCFAGID